FANDNCRRLNDNYEPRQMDITNLAMTGRSSCRRPAILVDVDHLFALRMKRSGARWKDQSGGRVITMRAHLLSDRWDRACQLALTKPSLEIHVA
ncbi:MAG: hypothetical protein K1X94_35345, partial [Sandaracinaceae bacterium]|nr:hypothetical protein [Sandaracinaceae bacterium]